MLGLLIATALASGAPAAPDKPVLPTKSPVLTLKDHRFSPQRIEVPAGQRVRVQLVNQDSTGEEFDSDELHVEKDVGPHGKATFLIGPLAPGEYHFTGELHAVTAQGVIVAVGPYSGQARE